MNQMVGPIAGEIFATQRASPLFQRHLHNKPMPEKLLNRPVEAVERGDLRRPAANTLSTWKLFRTASLEAGDSDQQARVSRRPMGARAARWLINYEWRPPALHLRRRFPLIHRFPHRPDLRTPFATGAADQNNE
jgi:hypothetical protein